MSRSLLIYSPFLLAGCISASHSSEHGPSRESFVPVAAGVSIHVLRQGVDSSRAPLFFIPGWGAEGAIWRHELDHFAQSRQVIAIDPRSQGHSTVTPVGNTPEQRAEDLHAVLSAMHLARPPVLIGWSQGVQDLAAYLSRYGDHDLAGVVFVDAAISAGASDVVRHPKQVAEAFALYDIYQKHQVDYLDGMWRAISRSATDAQRAEFVSAGMRTPSAIGVAELLADMYGVDRTSVLASIHKPALVIAAASSPDSAAERNMAARISGASIVEISNASHAVFLDQPAQFDTALDVFLKQLH